VNIEIVVGADHNPILQLISRYTARRRRLRW
jgi:hypothetical protein